MKQELTNLMMATTDLLRHKQRVLRRDIARVLCVKQFEETEQDLTRALIPFFKGQIEVTKRKLETLVGTRTHEYWEKNESPSAESLTAIVYEPLRWREKLINAALPVLSRSMGEAATAEISQAEGQINKTTASEWIDQEGLVDGELPPNLTTEFPPWMRDAIEVSLRETFEQDYWEKILETTGSDIEGFIRNGLQEGHSIAQMARNISDAFPLAYSRRRATTIARTESGNALSAARSLAIDHLKEESGEAGEFIKKSWLSVLGNTTRDEHAALDGVLEDENGMFNLAGFEIPWPSHFSLPVGQRANCMCSLTTEFGV